jgi:hypothetical protein
MTAPTIEQSGDKWVVKDGERILGEFPTNGAAWRWLDKHERRPLHIRSSTANWTGQGVYHDLKRDK